MPAKRTPRRSYQLLIWRREDALAWRELPASSLHKAVDIAQAHAARHFRRYPSMPVRWTVFLLTGRKAVKDVARGIVRAPVRKGRPTHDFSVRVETLIYSQDIMPSRT